MIIEIFSDGIERRDIVKSFHRCASRGIIIKDNLVMLLYVPKLDIYTFPGGGVENNETKSECLTRELAEETGWVVTNFRETVTVMEYFVDSTWENTYFICEVDLEHKGELHLTREELEYGIKEVWMSLPDALSLLDTYESKNEYGSNIHTREFIGLMNSI